jgi:hypothetical protein
MHQQAATGVMPQTAVAILAGHASLEHADGPDVLALETKFGGVVQNQHRLRLGQASSPSGLEMAGQQGGFADALVGEEPVSGLGVGPVLANQGDAFADPRRQLLQQHSKALFQPHIPELACEQFLLNPGCTRILTRPRDPVSAA